MICPNCGMILPEDSEFCQYCGFKLSSPIENTHTAEDADIAKNNGESIISSKTIVLEAENAHDKSAETIEFPPAKEKSSNKRRPALVCLSVLLLALAGLNVYQYISSQNNINKVSEYSGKINELNTQIANLNAEINNLKSTISKKDEQIQKKDSEITSLNNTISSLEDDSYNYNTIVDAVQNRNLGYASSNFQSSESIIIVGKNEKNRKFTLTANWSSGGTVIIDYDSVYPAATVDFDQDEWSTSTKMSVNPVHSGVTVVTFSNDVNRQSFDIIILVE